MSTTSKRFLLVASVALLIVVALLWRAPLGGNRYRAEAAVLAKPYANIFAARRFEMHLAESVPGVFRLRVNPSFKAFPGAGAPALPNGAVIHIISVGPSAAEAERAASEAAQRLCQIVLTNYGATGEIIDPGNTARRYSYLHDSFMPAVARAFKH